MKWIIEYCRNSLIFKWAKNPSVLALLIDLAVMEVSSWLHGTPAYDRSFVTARAEFRCESLPDESHVCLDGGSEIRVRFNGSTRNIDVLRGRASFGVHSDRRPFDVGAGRALVHDLSTGFVVSRQELNITRVVVTDGSVRVMAPANSDARSRFSRGVIENAWKSAPELQKFDQWEFDETSGEAHTLPRLNERQLLSLLAFEEGRIAVGGRTLSESLKDLARYQDLPTFKCSAATGSTPMAGSFLFNDVDGFLATLKPAYHIRSTTSGSGHAKVITLTRSPEKAGDIRSRC